MAFTLDTEARGLLPFYAILVQLDTFTVLRQNALTFTLPPPYGPVPLRGRPAAHGRRLRDRAATVATARARLRDHFSSRMRIRADRPTSHLCDPRRLWCPHSRAAGPGRRGARSRRSGSGSRRRTHRSRISWIRNPLHPTTRHLIRFLHPLSPSFNL